MAEDEKLAQAVRKGAPPALRIYGWERPAVSIGRRQKKEDLPEEILSQDLPVVRRPTGGGIVVHSGQEVTYSLAFPLCLIPKGVRVSALPVSLHRQVKDLLENASPDLSGQLRVAPRDAGGPYHLCFSAPVCGDILLDSKKVAGCAVRVWKEAVLMQGSIQGIPLPAGRWREILCEAVRRTFPG